MSGAPSGRGGPDDGRGVLGNLPRSRPGRRSGRREGGADGVDSAPAREPERAAPSPAAAQRPRAGRPRPANRAAPGGDRGRPAARPVSPAPESGGGALDGAARVAGRAARLGLGMLKRLPRP